MKLATAAAVTTTERPAPRIRPLRIATIAGVLAALVLLAFPAPRSTIEALGAPRDGVARFGGLQLWWQPPSDYDPTWLARRFQVHDIVATLDVRPGLVIVEMPGIRELDVPRMARRLTGDGRVEVRELFDQGALGDDVLFDAENIAEAVATSRLVSRPVVAFVTAPRYPALAERLEDHRVAVTVDRKLRWTATFHAALEGGLLWLVVDGHDHDGLAAALSAGALPGGTVLGVAYVPPADVTHLIWIVRLSISLAVALLVGLFLRAAASVMRDRAPRISAAPERSGADLRPCR